MTNQPTAEAQASPAPSFDDAFAFLAKYLKTRLGDAPSYFLADPGNWGDALIREGTLLFFRDIGLNYREIKSQEDLSKLDRSVTTFIYGGGGAWCKLWNHGELWATSMKQVFEVIVLPSTYEMKFAIPNTTLFCRDLYESKANVPAAMFCHDMAFYLKRIIAPAPGGSGEGYFFRTDAESARARPLPSTNDDISAKGTQFTEIGPFFQAVARVETVHTDRLHVAVAGCLLGKKVRLYPNSYFKNRAIYLTSLRGHFDNVEFMGPL